MSTKYKNIITPEFYSFLRSNKVAYGKAVLAQINDASENVAIDESENESIAIVLSALHTGVSDASAQGLINENKITSLEDGVPRRKIKFRSIDGRMYSSNLQDFTIMMDNPLEDGISEAEMQYRISKHPSAYTMGGYYQTNPMPFGTIVLIKKVGENFFVIDNISIPLVAGGGGGGFGGIDHPPKYDNTKDTALEQKWGLKRRRGNYSGAVAKYTGQTFYNGSLPYDILGLPNKKYWSPKGSGGGAILMDYVPSFNAMAFAFYNKFGKKFASSGIRSFKQQIINRKKSLPKSKGGNRGEDAGCKSLTQRGGGCGTAIPGRSNHGWGQAIDVRFPGTHTFITTKSQEYKWLMENAYKVGFKGIKWGHLGQKGTILSSQTFEAWHWEPLNGRVMKGI